MASSLFSSETISNKPTITHFLIEGEDRLIANTIAGKKVSSNLRGLLPVPDFALSAYRIESRGKDNG